MLLEERRRRILDALEQADVVSIADLAAACAVSPMTIRRDLELLEDAQLLRRTRGGAMRIQGGQAEPHFTAKQVRQAEVKERLANYAVEHLVGDDEVIILEGGTTVTAMVKYLRVRRNLTIVTHGLYPLIELRAMLPATTVICPGGILRDVSHTFVGPVTEQFFRQFHAQKAFLSATGFMPGVGFTDPNMLETQVKRCMLESAMQKIVLCDSSKFGIKAFSLSFTTSEIDIVVTDAKAPEEMLDNLRQHGVDVRVVP